MPDHSNIVVLEDSSKAAFGGGQKISLEVIKILAQRQRVFLVDCRGASLFKERAAPFLADTLELTCYGKIVGGANSSFAVGKLELLLFPFLLILSLVQMAVFFRRHRLQSANTLLYATTNKTLLQAFIIKKLFRIDYIFHAHSYHDCSSLYYKLIFPALKASKRIITVSEFIRNNIGLPQCRTLYNPVELVGAAPKSLQAGKGVTAATFSTLLKWKGIDSFMESFRYLRNGERVHFLVFGNGPEQKALKRLENERVQLQGFVENSESIMRDQVDIVVVPSISAEACPMVPLEAFARGIPVVSTDIGGQAEIVRHEVTGLLVPIKDPEAIAQGIDYLVEHPDIYNEMSKNCLDYAQRHDTKNYAKSILRLFEKQGA